MSVTAEVVEEAFKLLIQGVRSIVKDQKLKDAGAALAAVLDVVDAADDVVTEHATVDSLRARIAGAVGDDAGIDAKADADFEKRWGRKPVKPPG